MNGCFDGFPLSSPTMIQQRKECCQGGVHLSSPPFVFLVLLALVKIPLFCGLFRSLHSVLELWVACQDMSHIPESQKD